jgi:hypothetical protein
LARTPVAEPVIHIHNVKLETFAYDEDTAAALGPDDQLTHLKLCCSTELDFGLK